MEGPAALVDVTAERTFLLGFYSILVSFYFETIFLAHEVGAGVGGLSILVGNGLSLFLACVLELVFGFPLLLYNL